jgi:surface protein
MNGTFVSAVKFNQDISNWDTSKVINFTAMFQMTIFNQDISGWDTSSATTMEGMFSSATQFNQDLSSWIVSKVTNHVNFDTGATAWVLPRPAFPS